MTRDALCLTVEDLSAFARNLHKQLAAEPALPGHLSLLNMLARAAGFRVRGAFFVWPNRLRQMSSVFARTWQGRGLLAYYRVVEATLDLVPWRGLSRRLFIGAVLAKNVCLVLEKPSARA